MAQWSWSEAGWSSEAEVARGEAGVGWSSRAEVGARLYSRTEVGIAEQG